MDSEPLRRLNLFVFGSVDKKSNVWIGDSRYSYSSNVAATPKTIYSI